MRSEGCSKFQVLGPEIDLAEIETTCVAATAHCKRLGKENASLLFVPQRRHSGARIMEAQDQRFGLKQTMGIFSKERSGGCLQFPCSSPAIGDQVEISPSRICFWTRSPQCHKPAPICGPFLRPDLFPLRGSRWRSSMEASLHRNGCWLPLKLADLNAPQKGNRSWPGNPRRHDG